MAPVDGSTFAEEAVKMAVSLLSPESIELSLTCVVGTPERETPVAREILADAAKRLANPGLDINTTILTGAAASQINAFAIDGGYDLIVMSTHGRGMLARALVGSVADQVVRTSEVPVLVIQPDSMETPFDPVSGEDVDLAGAAYTAEYRGRTFAFTSFEHKLQFEGAPEAYIGRRLDPPTGFPTPDEGLAVGPLGHVAVIPPSLRDA
jgi:nucleotide-binding universal stress UspA family protein/YHS domain-containing protein